MKAIFIIFNQAYYETILQIMERIGIKGFTFVETVSGCGSRGGEPHLGTHAWPTLNSALMTIVEEGQVDRLLKLLNKLDKQAEDQGLRAFVLPVEQTV